MNTKGQARFLGQVAELWSCKQCADLGVDLVWSVNASLYRRRFWTEQFRSLLVKASWRK